MRCTGNIHSIFTSTTRKRDMAEEVETTSDEEDQYEPMPARRRVDDIHEVPPSSPLQGSFETVHNPDEPTIEEELIERRAARPFVFFLRAAPGHDAARKLHRITLPRSWNSSNVSRLTTLLSKRYGLPAWDCHLECVRGPVDSRLAICAAIVRKEVTTLARGPPPLTPTALARNRRTLWIWGRCVDGVVLPAPRRQPGLGVHQVLRVGVGEEHVVVATQVGLVLSWGRNDCGQLGTGDERSVAAPRVIRVLAAVRCVDVACGARCSGAIEEAGRLWTFGANQPSNQPQPFHASWCNAHAATSAGLDVCAVAFGHTHTLALTRSGVVWSWGYNEAMQLGWTEAVANHLLRIGFQKPRTPLAIDAQVVAIACGEAHSACITSTGAPLHASPRLASPCLAMPRHTTPTSRSQPASPCLAMPRHASPRHATLPLTSSLAVPCSSSAGELLAWGDNSTGQCGAQAGGLGAAIPTPTAVPMPRGDGVIRRLLCLGNATLAISASGRAYTLGGGGRLAAEKDDDDDDNDDDDGDAADGALDEDAADAEDAAHRAGGGGGGDGGDGAATAARPDSLSRGLGRLLGARRLLAEGMADAAGCADHLLLLDRRGRPHGLGYNRYRQACPADPRLRLADPTAHPPNGLGIQRVLALAAGGGCSLALTEARETLSACCVAVRLASPRLAPCQCHGQACVCRDLRA